MKETLALIFPILFLPFAHGEFIYVDANETNTTLDGESLVLAPIEGFNVFDGNSGTDNLWSLRSGGFEGGDYFETDPASTNDETAGNLITSITLPTAGTYDIVVIYGDLLNATTARDIAARIGSAPTASDTVNANSFLSTDANQDADPLKIDFDSSYTNARSHLAAAAYLGTVTTTSDNETVEIYVNGFTKTAANDDERTHYDGVGYQLVVPVDEYTYVDANPSNTTLNSDPENFPDGVALEAGLNFIDDGTGGSSTDNLWTFRTDSAFATFENANAFESDGGADGGLDRESTSDLITTIRPPVAGVYEVVALFTQSSNRDIAARIGASPGPDDIFSGSNALSAQQLGLSPDISFDETFTNSRGSNSGVAYLGTVVTSSDDEAVKIYVNGLAINDVNDDERTQYEGIGYRLVNSGGGTSFGDWIAGFSVGDLNGVSDDADGDGIDNGVENFFGTAPDAFSQGLLSGTKTGNAFTFIHPQSATPASDLSANYLWSTDLVNWYAGDGNDGPTSGPTVSITPNTVDGTTIVTSTPSESLSELFLRVQVLQN